MKNVLLIPILTFAVVLQLSLLKVPTANAQTPSPAKPNPPYDDKNVGILYGENFVYSVTAPQGWVLDNQSGSELGVDAVFYPKNSSWSDTKVFFYPNVTTKKKGDSLTSFIQYDVANYRNKRKTKSIADGTPITVRSGKTVPVKYFLGDMNGNYEACAYVDEKNVVVFLVISSKEEKLFRQSLPAFTQWVASYEYLTNKGNVMDQVLPPMDFGIPVDVLKKAKKETDAEEGQKYDASMGNVMQAGLGANIQQCLKEPAAQGSYQMVLVVDKTGVLKHLYAEKHNEVYDCLIPKLRTATLPTPPYEPFYYHFEINVTK